MKTAPSPAESLQCSVGSNSHALDLAGARFCVVKCGARVDRVECVPSSDRVLTDADIPLSPSLAQPSDDARELDSISHHKVRDAPPIPTTLELVRDLVDRADQCVGRIGSVT